MEKGKYIIRQGGKAIYQLDNGVYYAVYIADGKIKRDYFKTLAQAKKEKIAPVNILGC